jgi:predicted transcriptional regulator
MNDTTKEIVNDPVVSAKIINLLMDLGISECESKILVILNKNTDGLKQKDICDIGYLYQPEVSIGLKRLMSKRWVTIVNRVSVKKKGRPFGIYALYKSFDEILNEIEEGVTGKYELIMSDIERVKQIA